MQGTMAKTEWSGYARLANDKVSSTSIDKHCEYDEFMGPLFKAAIFVLIDRLHCRYRMA